MLREFFNNKFSDELKFTGWNKIDAGKTKSINYNNCCAVYVYHKKIAEILKSSAKNKVKKPVKSTKNSTPTESLMEYSKGVGGYLIMRLHHLLT